MDHFKKIYHDHAPSYHKMVSLEDVDQNLLPALERVTSFTGKRILDLGTGTGRIPLLTADLASQLVGLDLHRGMLRENRTQRDVVDGNWDLVQADMRILPFPDNWAHVVIAGWAIGHFRGWYADHWRTQIGRVIKEMNRVLLPGGALIVIETLTTGSLTPAPPTEELGEYYAWLEDEWGFSRQQVSTDYMFDSLEDAVESTEFFFGPELSAKMRENNWVRLPEWTGIWGKIMDQDSSS
jgi:ubiquinone/menaquinone biosynthesis C-methylase UbiE